jgi:hypothetical protein
MKYVWIGFVISLAVGLWLALSPTLREGWLLCIATLFAATFGATLITYLMRDPNSQLMGFWDIYRSSPDESERLIAKEGDGACDDTQAFRAWQHTVHADWDRYERGIK